MLARVLGLPLRGGSGLKFEERKEQHTGCESPSARREWIEIWHVRHSDAGTEVSLCEEGVD